MRPTFKGFTMINFAKRSYKAVIAALVFIGTWLSGDIDDDDFWNGAA